MIKEEINQIKESKKDLRKFGYTVGIVILIIAAFLFYKEKPAYIYLTVLGLFLIFSAFIFPQILRPLNKLWMTLAILLGFVMTRVILSLLFYLVLTPLRFIALIFGKRFLDLGIDKNKTSYWEKREKRTTPPAEYERQF